MEQCRTLRQILRQADYYSSRCWLFLPKDVRWTLESPCLVEEFEEVPIEDEDEADAGLPEIVKEQRMMPALSIAQVQDLVSNLKEQRPTVDDDTLFDAFIYYYDNDAFLMME